MKVTINGVSANGKFDLTDKVVTVEITVVADVIYGDVNGDNSIDMKDVGLVLRAYLEKAELTDSQKVAADVVKDGSIDMKDVGAILRKYLEKLDKFPVEEN